MTSKPLVPGFLTAVPPARARWLRGAILLAFTLIAGACRLERDDSRVAQPPVTTAAEAEPGTFVLGHSVTPEGAIAEGAAVNAFHRGMPVLLSIDASGASIDSEYEIRWVDAAGRAQYRERRVVEQGSQYAVFSTGSTAGWAPGLYRVAVIIDDRRVSEQAFRLL